MCHGLVSHTPEKEGGLGEEACSPVPAQVVVLTGAATHFPGRSDGSPAIGLTSSQVLWEKKE